MAGASVNWAAYAQVYDIMAEHNPAYQKIVETCLTTVCGWPLQPGDCIVDLGAGTGNFSVPLADRLPYCTVIHMDADPAMCAIAQQKAARHGLRNHSVVTSDACQPNLAPGSLAGIISVHSLYAMQNPPAVIELMEDWLAPQGRVFACDPGRRLDLFDWTCYILGETRRRKGMTAAARLIWDARAAITQNRRIGKRQRIGDYWLHNLQEFQSAFENAGFAIERSFTCYRNYSDVVVAQKTGILG